MSLQLQVINIPEGELLAETLYRIPTSGGIVGRAPDCAVPLPDSSRFLSGHHARVFQEDSQWLIEDLSTNGLMINNATSPLGSGKRHTLTDGDILTCGDYRIMVNLFSPDISHTTGIAESLEDVPLEPPVSDDPFSASPARLAQSTAMVLDDPFNDSVQAGSQAFSPNTARLNEQGESITFGHEPKSQSIDQLPDSYTATASRLEPANLINVLEHSEPTIPEQAEETKAQVTPGFKQVSEEASSVRSTPTNSVQTMPAPLPETQDAPLQRIEQVASTPALTGSAQDMIFQLQEENFRLREQLKRKNKLVKKAIYHAMGQALEQTLMDFSPEYLEKLFDDYSGKKSGLFRKRDNWALYSRHFQRLLKEQTCRLAFTARFQAALRKMQEKNA